MKSTGIVRRLDSLGRIVLPVELRRLFTIDDNDMLEIYVDGDTIILKKHQPTCIFCESTTALTDYKGKNLCKKCIKKLCEDISQGKG